MPEAFPGAIITFPMLGESFSLNPSGTYTLFGHTFYWYGAIIGLGFILAALYCMRRAPKDFGISKDTLTDVVLIGLPTAIVGARLYYVFCHWSSYVGDTVWQTLWNWCKIWEGGTAIPGGLLLATFCVWLYARKKKIPFGAIMDKSYIILTDSGGIQEEAPSLNKPVLVLRDTTERQEGVEAGVLKLIGTSEENIYNACTELLNNREEYNDMINRSNPYGDGFACRRIADILAGE